MLYKILTKTLVNRFQPILQDCISLDQSAFLPGRGPVDNTVTLQEILGHIASSHCRSQSIVLKIDIAKAYDNVR